MVICYCFVLLYDNDEAILNDWILLILHISARPKPGFGIGNQNQDQVSVSVSGPELFLPKPKLSPILKMYQKIISVMT